MLNDFLREEDGMGVVEIVIIIAVLVGVAILFRNTLVDYAEKLIGSMFTKDAVDINTNKVSVPIPVRQ